MPALQYDRFDVLTFDCYGTLIDWETGLATAMRAALPGASDASDDELLEHYARHEAELEAGPYLPYREVLSEALRRVAAERGLELSEEAAARFGGSVVDWPAFPDSAEALGRLKQRFRLGVVTNCDSDLFAASHERLGGVFDHVVTAQMARAYKPSHRGFELAFATVGAPRERILHVAQSLHHDHVPAAELGLASVFIDRRHDRPGSGATPPAEASPDARFTSMRAFADDALDGG